MAVDLDKERARLDRRRQYQKDYYSSHKDDSLDYHKRRYRDLKTGEREKAKPDAVCSCCGRGITAESATDFDGMGPICAAGLCNCKK